MLILISSPVLAFGFEQGIYLTQPTIESTSKLTKLISKAKKAGITTFIVDVNYQNKRYARNIAKIKAQDLKLVFRVVVFPHGGKQAQVRSRAYWEKQYKLVDYAVSLGADEIQLDYIRYKPSKRASTENIQDIKKVIEFFKDKLEVHNIPLQIDVFGETSFKASKNIGQDLQAFANIVDVVCPMVYPSHYYPYGYHSKRPYFTINKSLTALRAQFDNQLPFKLIPYIEVRNFRYQASRDNRIKYIGEQIRAVKDNQADGWYAWSPTNKYDNLFRYLNSKPES